MNGEILKSQKCSDANGVNPFYVPPTRQDFNECGNVEKGITAQNAMLRQNQRNLQTAHETMGEIADVTCDIGRLSESIRIAMIGEVTIPESCCSGGDMRLSSRMWQELERLKEIRLILEQVRGCL